MAMAASMRVPWLCGAALVATAVAQQPQFEPFPFGGQALLPPMPVYDDIAYPLTGDIDGDGRSDLVIVSSAGLAVDYALGDGSYIVSLDPNVLLAARLAAAKLVDWDRDGALDLLVVQDGEPATPLPSLLYAFHNQGGALPLAQTVSLGTTTRTIAMDPLRVADVDGDGDTDVLVASGSGTQLVRNAGGSFLAPTVAVAGAWPAFELLDADGDGDLDLVQGDSTSIRLFANDGTGVFTFATTVHTGTALNMTGFGAVDLDRDGDLDLFAAMVGVFRNDGNRHFTNITQTSLPRAYDTTWSSVVRCADFDGDGITDVLLPGARPMQFQPLGVLLQGNGNGTFTDISTRLQPALANHNFNVGLLDVGDVDDDGDVDILAWHRTSFPPYDFVLANHHRQVVLATPLQLGQIAHFDIFGRPSYAVPRTSWLAAALGPVGRPFALAGIDGRVLIDPTDPLIVGVTAHTTATTGHDVLDVAVPQASYLIGLTVWFEAMMIPDPGVPVLPGLTNAVSGYIIP